MRHLSVHYRARLFKTVSHTDAQGHLSYCPHTTWDIITLWTMLGWAVAVTALFNLNGKTQRVYADAQACPLHQNEILKDVIKHQYLTTSAWEQTGFFLKTRERPKLRKKWGLTFDKQYETSQMLMFPKVSNRLLTHTVARCKVVICQKTYATNKLPKLSMMEVYACFILVLVPYIGLASICT